MYCYISYDDDGNIISISGSPQNTKDKQGKYPIEFLNSILEGNENIDNWKINVYDSLELVRKSDLLYRIIKRQKKEKLTEYIVTTDNNFDIEIYYFKELNQLNVLNDKELVFEIYLVDKYDESICLKTYQVKKGLHYFSTPKYNFKVKFREKNLKVKGNIDAI